MSQTKQFRKRENQETYQRSNGTYGVRSINTEPSMTQQQFKQDCDVNYIMDKFLKTGTITHVKAQPGKYLDLVEMPDYNESHLTIARANSAFAELDARVRQEFDNDPAKFIAYRS